MKKMLALLSALLLLGMPGGCGKKQEDYRALVLETLGRGFSFTAAIDYGGQTAVAAVDKTAGGDMTVAFSEPELLSGLTVSMVGSDVTALYRGMEVRLNAKRIAFAGLVWLDLSYKRQATLRSRSALCLTPSSAESQPYFSRWLCA